MIPTPTTPNLANSLRRVAQTNPSNLSRHLNPGEIRRLIEAVRTDDCVRRRNYATGVLETARSCRYPR